MWAAVLWSTLNFVGMVLKTVSGQNSRLQGTEIWFWLLYLACLHAVGDNAHVPTTTNKPKESHPHDIVLAPLLF